MKIAIVGAGVAGLACAFELEKHGITPTIFEYQNHIGHPLNIPNIWLNNRIRFNHDPIKFLNKKHELSLKPLNKIKKMICFSNTNKYKTVKLSGYILGRGISKLSLENQIAEKLTTPIDFNTHISIKNIPVEFEHVIISSGNNTSLRELNLWKNFGFYNIRCAEVVGNFEISTIMHWEYTYLDKKILCYLVPKSSKNASIIQMLSNSTTHDLNFYWEHFLLNYKLNYYITEVKDCVYTTGYMPFPKKNNLYFIGNIAKSTYPYKKMPSFFDIESGITIARSILTN